MPRLELLFRCGQFTHGEYGALPNSYAVLARRDVDGRYDPQGTLTEDVFELAPPIVMEQLESFFGFEVYRRDGIARNDGSGPSDGVEFQLSTDGGSTYLSWDGAAWTEDPLRWTPALVVEEFIDQMPVGLLPSFSIRMRLQPVDDVSPVVREISIFYELSGNSSRYNFEEDLERSLRRTIESRIAVPFKDIIRYNGTSLQVTAPTPVQTVLSVEGVWDPDNDPGKTNNLLGSWTGKQITLSSAPIGSRLMVIGTGRPKVILGGEPDYVDEDMPYIFVDLLSLMEDGRFRTSEVYEINIPKELARKRWHPVRQRATFTARCIAARRKDSIRMADAMKVAFQRRLMFRAIGSGQICVVNGFTPIAGSDRIADNMYERMVSMMVDGWDFADPEGYREVPLTSLARAGYGDFTTRYGVVEVAPST